MMHLHLPRGALVEGLASSSMHRRFTRVPLPATDCCVDIQRIDFNPIADTSDALGRHQSRSRSEEGIEHHLAAGGAIEQRIGHESDGFYRRMECKQVALVALAGLGLYAGVLPDVRAASPKLAELNVVAVLTFAVEIDK